MAGYLAAGMSQTKKVGTFGGLKIPTVTIFMDGYAQGVQYYNEQKSDDGPGARLERGQAGRPVRPGDSRSRTSRAASASAQGLISQGADIIFPVAGPAGEGALQAAKASGGKVNAIWVDTDGCVSAETYCPQIITSVNKGLDVAVFDAIKAAKDGTFDNEPVRRHPGERAAPGWRRTTTSTPRSRPT